MSLALELPPELESELTAEAARHHLPLTEYAVRLLAGSLRPVVRTGSELVAYWQLEGVVGSRADIANGPEHARNVREQAQR
jgi:hypothetical protein